MRMLVELLDTSVDSDVRFVSKVTISLFDVQIKIAPLRHVSQLFPVDTVLHLQLKYSLTCPSPNHVNMAPNIRNLYSLEISQERYFY